MINKLDLTTACRAGITYLKDAYYTPPFKLLPVGEDRHDPWLRLMLMSSSPGILNGDQYELTLHLAENTRLHLQTQSYQRLFHMKEGASQHLEVNMARGSHFYFIPHPSVPHEKSIFRGHSVLHLAADSSLVWGEIVTCGRKHSGEVFKFTHFQNLTEVYRAGQLVFKDHLLLLPNDTAMAALGQFEGFTHQATLFCLGEQPATPALADQVHELLSQEKKLAFGVSLTAHHGLLVRLLGHGGEQLLRCLNQVGNLVQPQLAAPVPAAPLLALI
jgi:urease accessory protein